MEEKPHKHVKYIDRLKAGLANLRQKVEHSIKNWRQIINTVRRRPVSGNQIMRSDTSRLVNRIGPEQYGHICTFFYDPKWKEKLPFYDTFPLVIPLQPAKGGFLGLNMHYLPPGHRAVLMDALYNSDLYPPKDTINDQTQIKINYKRLKAIVNNRYFVPCIKHYLYSHTRSRFFMVPVQDWDTFLFLPTERFEKKNIREVYQDSLLKIRQSSTTKRRR